MLKEDNMKYYTIYKPYQVLSQFTSVEGKETLASFNLSETDIYPVGRLDYDSEGLLILTNDNYLKTQLLNPKIGHKRKYLVQVEGEVSEQCLDNLRKGLKINIDGKLHQTKYCDAEKLNHVYEIPDRNPPIRFRKNIPTNWIELTLTEGKNRQVRKMTAAIGHPTLRLIRIAIENLTLGNMQPGDIILQKKNDIYNLLKIR